MPYGMIVEIYTEDFIGRYTVEYSKFHDTVDVGPQ